MMLQVGPAYLFGNLFLIIIALIVVALVASAIKVVPEYKRLVILRLGRFIGVRGPGLVLRIPIIDRLLWVDLREGYFTVPHQTCITKDNAPTAHDTAMTTSTTSQCRDCRCDSPATGLIVALVLKKPSVWLIPRTLPTA